VTAEIEATRRTAGLFDLSASHAAIGVTGRDRVAFLQGMTTSDVAGLAEGAAQPSAIVNANGRLVATFLVVRLEQEILLACDAARREATLETLGRLIVADEVELTDRSSDGALFSLQGPLAAHLLGHACAGIDAVPHRRFDASETETPEGRALVVRHDRFAQPGYDMWVARAGASAFEERILACGSEHGLVMCGPDTFETLRVLAGTAAWGREIDDRSFPQEVGLSSVVSSTKGCYVGQEVLARILFQGEVKRVLARVALDRAPAASAALPIPLAREGSEEGRLTSVARDPTAAHSAGLAVVRRAGASVGAVYEARPANDAPFRATVVEVVT
jgi:folate-binding protein YgfZ